jgi:hypothetical protein
MTRGGLLAACGWLLCSLVLPAGAASLPPPVVHHDAHVTLDPAQGAMDVRNTITLEGEGRLALDLDPAFVVQSLSVDGETRASERAGETLIVDVGKAGPHTLALHTQANLATQAPAESPPFLGPEGGFLTWGWLAQPQDRSATYRVQVTSPLPHIAVLPGELSDETRSDGVYRATFSSTIADDAPVLISGPFDVMQKQAGEVQLRTYFHAELAPLAQGYLDDAARYIEAFAKQIGPYPYPGFAMVSGPLPIGIGLPGMTYMGREVLALPFIRTTSLPHEVLHNWWGNAVRIDYARGNWAEGLTTYQADHDQSATRNQDGEQSIRLEWLRNYAALPIDRDVPVTAFQSKTHDASQVVGYGKVAFIFHMLKVRLGTDGFDQAIQRFYADNRFRTASWSDIQAAFEHVSGQDLGAFFDAWLNRPGAPRLALQDVTVEDMQVSFAVVQTQDDAAYPLSLSAVLETATGEQRVRLDMTQKRQTYHVTADARPTELSIDADIDGFRRLSAEEIPPIFRDVTLNANTRLIAPGSTPIARTLAEALMQGPVPETAEASFKGTLIVAGLKTDVTPFLNKSGLPRPPAALDASAPALAYVVREASGRTTLVAMADDTAGLEALARVLPHYKRQSFAVMHDGRVTDKGAWPAATGPLSLRLD